MKIKYIIYVLLAIGLVFFGVSAAHIPVNQSPKDTTPAETYAIIIGIADYKYMGKYSGDLSYTKNDAVMFAKFLKSPAGGSVPNKNIYFLLDQKARKQNILHYAKKLFAQATPNDKVIFFFSGHGQKGAFLPYNAYVDDNNITKNMLRFSDLKEIFKASRSQTKLLFADACYAGTTKTDIQNKQHKVKPQTDNKDYEILFMMSCDTDEISMELPELKQGIFSYYLIKGLKGMADDNSDGLVSAWELHKYVNFNVKKKAKSRFNHNQNPITFGSFDKNMVVSKAVR
jgi:uncharacterized caspase-like protein